MLETVGGSRSTREPAGREHVCTHRSQLGTHGPTFSFDIDRGRHRRRCLGFDANDRRQRCLRTGRCVTKVKQGCGRTRRDRETQSNFDRSTRLGHVPTLVQRLCQLYRKPVFCPNNRERLHLRSQSTFTGGVRYLRLSRPRVRLSGAVFARLSACQSQSRRTLFPRQPSHISTVFVGKGRTGSTKHVSKDMF